MNTEFSAFDNVHHLGETATYQIARFLSCLTALLLLAGPGMPRRRALPVNSKTAHSGTSNCRF